MFTAVTGEETSQGDDSGGGFKALGGGGVLNPFPRGCW